jgi:hypothetical protein
MTRHSTRSTITGVRALATSFGACDPASFHARLRATPRAVSMAANAARASAASAVIVRETVASEATRLYRPGSLRSKPMSARQSPPNANVTARSRMTLAGSWTLTAYANRTTPPTSPDPNPPRRSSRSIAPHRPDPPPQSSSCRPGCADRTRHCCSPGRCPLNVRILDLDNPYLRRSGTPVGRSTPTHTAPL